MPWLIPILLLFLPQYSHACSCYENGALEFLGAANIFEVEIISYSTSDQCTGTKKACIDLEYDITNVFKGSLQKGRHTDLIQFRADRTTCDIEPTVGDQVIITSIHDLFSNCASRFTPENKHIQFGEKISEERRLKYDQDYYREYDLLKKIAAGAFKDWTYQDVEKLREDIYLGVFPAEGNETFIQSFDRAVKTDYPVNSWLTIYKRDQLDRLRREKQKILELSEVDFFTEANTAGTIESYTTFIERFPNGIWADAARRKIDNLIGTLE